MRTDFREERKQKIKAAYILALAVQDWHMAEDKSIICVKVTTKTVIFVQVYYKFLYLI